MTDSSDTTQTQGTSLEIPLWLAVSITVFLSMPFSLWLGHYNFTLWCSFIVWAQYFALGAKISALRLIIPSFSAGVAMTSVTLYVIPAFSFIPDLFTKGDLSSILVISGGVAAIVFVMEKSTTLSEGSLPFFNGVTMALALFFSGSYPSGPLPDVVSSGIWAILMGFFGAFLGVFNVWLMKPDFSFLSRSSGKGDTAG